MRRWHVSLFRDPGICKIEDQRYKCGKHANYVHSPQTAQTATNAAYLHSQVLGGILLASVSQIWRNLLVEVDVNNDERSNKERERERVR